MAGSTRRARERVHLRLVSRAKQASLPPLLTDPGAREEFDQVTLAQIDAAIERGLWPGELFARAKKKGRMVR
jgi:hypothetical protein